MRSHDRRMEAAAVTTVFSDPATLAAGAGANSIHSPRPRPRRPNPPDKIAERPSLRGPYPRCFLRMITSFIMGNICGREGGWNTHLWTWSGKDFGDREGDELWTYDGRHVGHFHGTEVYAPDGRYLGELQRDDHLITRIIKQPRASRERSRRCPIVRRGPPLSVSAAFPCQRAYEDFPDPDALR